MGVVAEQKESVHVKEVKSRDYVEADVSDFISVRSVRQARDVKHGVSVVKGDKEGGELYELVGEGDKFVMQKTVTKSDSIIERKRKLGIETETRSSSSQSHTSTPSSPTTTRSTTTRSTTTPSTSATLTSSTTCWQDSGKSDQSDQSVWEMKRQSEPYLLNTTKYNQETFTVRDRIAILEGATKVGHGDANLPPNKNLDVIYRFGSTNTLDVATECSPLKRRKLNTNYASSSTPPSRATTCPKSMTATSISLRSQRSLRSLNQRHSMSSHVSWAPGMTVTGSPSPWGPEPLSKSHHDQSESRKIQGEGSDAIRPSTLPSEVAHPTLLCGDCAHVLSSSASGKLFSRTLTSGSNTRREETRNSLEARSWKSRTDTSTPRRLSTSSPLTRSMESSCTSRRSGLIAPSLPSGETRRTSPPPSTGKTPTPREAQGGRAPPCHVCQGQGESQGVK